MQLLKMASMTLLLCMQVFAQTSGTPGSDLIARPTQMAERQSGVANLQQSPGQSPGVVPQHVLYRFFFHHLAALEQMAAQRDQVGKGGVWRTHEQRTIGLTDAQGQAMKQIAFQCNQAVAELDNKFKATVAELRSQYPRGQPVPIEVRASLRQLQDKRIQTINTFVEQLRSQLGDASFQRVDAYVHTRFQVTRTPVPLPTVRGSGSTTNISPAAVR